MSRLRPSSFPRAPGKHWHKSILFRTAMLSWMLIIVTLGLYVHSMLPYQRATAVGRMRSEAHGIAASIGEVTAHAIILEDYSFAVDHCTQVLSKSPSIRYVVITKHDGFSLIHTADEWRMGQLGGIWTPSDDASQEGRFMVSELAGDEVFHYSYPLSYSAIDWGWIHIGLSLEAYHADLGNSRARTLWVATGCIAVGLLASLLFARRLSRPILSLSAVAQQITEGDLSARAELSTGDEVERLSHAFNRMTVALQEAKDELEMRVRNRTEELAKANDTLRGEIAERTRMEEELRRRAALDRVRAEMFAMRGADDLERSLSILEQELRTIMDFGACSVQIASDSGGFTVYTMEGGPLRKKEALPLPKEGPAHEAWTTGHPVYRRDLEKEDPYGEREALEEAFGGEGIRAAVDAPFLQGTLSVYSGHPDPFPEKDIETISAFAAVLSEGLDRIESREQIERQNRRLAVLNEIGNNLSSTLNFDELLHRAYEQLARAMNVSTFYIALHDEEHNELHFELRVHEGELLKKSSRKLLKDRGFSEVVLRSGKPLLLGDSQAEKGRMGIEGVVMGPGQSTQSWLGVPLMSDGKGIGLMAVQSYKLNAFDGEDQKFLSAAAHQVAIAIKNTRLVEEIQDQAKFYEDIFNSISIPISVIDEQEIIRSVNEAFIGHARKLGREIGETDRIGGSVLDFCDPEEKAEWASIYEDAIEKGIQYRAERAVGPYVMDVGVHPLRGRDDRITGAVLTQEDITERKRMEAELAQRAEALARSNAELEHFAYVASHDLQEPLRKIQAFGDRLKSKSGDALGDRGRDYLERMQSAAGRMRILINDLLAFSRVTSQGKPFVPVDLLKVAREVVEDLEVRIEETGARVQMDGLPTVDADPLQMRQLLQNLIGNALKFHREEVAPVVTLGGEFLEAEGENGGLVQITVEDNGIGFDEKYADRIFGIFQRLHGRGAYEGTGVGLAICRKIVERHGGHIAVRSKSGEGATFIVTLPIKPSKGEDAS